LKLQVKKYNLGDEYKILKLFNDVFNKEMSLKYWKWRYKKDRKMYINLMLDGQKIVGHYALFPIEIILKNKVMRTGFSMTTMTLREYSRLGIFKTLAKDLYLHCFNDLNIIWGFPNNNSLHGFVKNLNWIHVFDINMLIKDVYFGDEDINCSNRYINEIVEFSNEYNNLGFEFARRYDFIVNRNKDYLNWRFIKNPVNKYHILEYRKENILKGYCVYKLYKDELYFIDIVDILAIDNNIFKELIVQVIVIARIRHIRYVNIWMEDKELRDFLYNIGFVDSGKITHFGICKNNDMTELDSINDYVEKYYLTMSDSDVF
jgi:hypothetical protein